MSTLWQDITYGVRTLRRSPGFATVALLTLALGIGATTAIFSVIDAVLLRPLPYRDPDRLVMIWNRMVSTNFPHAPIAAPDILDYRTRGTLFESIAISNNVPEVSLTGTGEPEQIRLAGVSGNFFQVIGAAPFLGRDFTSEDDPFLPPGPAPAGGPPVPVILSHELWQRRFGGDPAAVGTMIRLDDQPREIVGVMPQGFRVLMPPGSGMPQAIDAWIPLRVDLARLQRDFQFLRAIGRLKPGVTVEQAQDQMNDIASWQREQFQFHRNMGMHIDVLPMQADLVRLVRPTLLALSGTVAFVLLIACANVANLLLARGAARRREMAVRAALGAAPARLVRQVLTEGLVLAAGGALLGVVLARVALAALVALRPADLPRVEAVQINAAVLGFTLAVAMLSAIVFALVPALSAVAPVTAVLNDRHTGRRSAGLSGTFVVAEVALSLVLLIGAGLMIRSFGRLQSVDPGFDPRGVTTFNIALPFSRYPQPETRARFFEQLEVRLRALPGVTEVGGVFPMPLAGRLWTGPYGRETDPQDVWTHNEANFRIATPGYFAAMGTRVLAGRVFTLEESRERREVVVVDRRLAARVWPGEQPVGKLLGIDLFGTKSFKRIVGVVDHVRHESLAVDSRETIYFPFHAFPFPPLTVAMRVASDPAAVVEPMRREIQQMDPNLAVYGVRSMDEYVSSALAPTRFATWLIALFAAVALALASIGLYGVLSYVVGQRMHEFGVRIALGAGRAAIFRMVVGRGLGMAIAGVAVGALGAIAFTRAIATLLFSVSPTDPITFLTVSAFLLVVVAAACYIPARRATRVDPIVSLRE